MSNFGRYVSEKSSGRASCFLKFQKADFCNHIFKCTAKVCTFVLSSISYSVLFHALQGMSSKLSMTLSKPQCSFSSSQSCFRRPQLLSLWSSPVLKYMFQVRKLWKCQRVPFKSSKYIYQVPEFGSILLIKSFAWLRVGISPCHLFWCNSDKHNT